MTTHLLPIIKWSGGKRSEINNILPHIPEFETYVEPFAGGASLFFHLNSDNKKNVINDVHPELINFYQQIANGNRLKIHELMGLVENTEEDYYKIRATDILALENGEFFSSYEKEVVDAFIFFYIRKTCYRGMMRYNKNGDFNIPFGRYKTYNYDILLNGEYEKLLSNTEITCLSYSDIFEKYGQDENAFFFLDPPYDCKFTDYGYCKFEEQDQRNLAECFKNSRAKCLMVIGDTPLIRELYYGFISDDYEKKYAFKLHSNRVNENAKQLVIKNY